MLIEQIAPAFGFLIAVSGFVAGAVWAVAEIRSVSKVLSTDIKHLTDVVRELKDQQHEYVREYNLYKEATSTAINLLKERISMIEQKCLHFHGGGCK